MQQPQQLLLRLRVQMLEVCCAALATARLVAAAPAVPKHHLKEVQVS
jgi:hypothetical protein